uniref:Uncharacterized protein n=1 Tax=Chromera velia CCMP2878 TaxID=1169474 RepID=A0A0G4HWL5_9ALVE|eukprot:Cvel_9061.t1-p1 / transcript=Cvel_9061.t1 / gene=Cvel_9061 / organism=Chromera_velia_CCMP2878 / gene_product=hypothetical protein / transcript_product=hypothetical protein / location=Cvel_scaffold514:9244-16115(-) / protein_length=879 / sequence_SO=supercontig / SO=protein_coding / is_pseudo=false
MLQSLSGPDEATGRATQIWLTLSKLVFLSSHALLFVNVGLKLRGEGFRTFGQAFVITLTGIVVTACFLIVSWFASCRYIRSCVRQSTTRNGDENPSVLTEILPLILISLIAFLWIWIVFTGEFLLADFLDSLERGDVYGLISLSVLGGATAFLLFHAGLVGAYWCPLPFAVMAAAVWGVSSWRLCSTWGIFSSQELCLRVLEKVFILFVAVGFADCGVLLVDGDRAISSTLLKGGGKVEIEGDGQGRAGMSGRSLWHLKGKGDGGGGTASVSLSIAAESGHRGNEIEVLPQLSLPFFVVGGSMLVITILRLAMLSLEARSGWIADREMQYELRRDRLGRGGRIISSASAAAAAGVGGRQAREALLTVRQDLDLGSSGTAAGGAGARGQGGPRGGGGRLPQRPGGDRGGDPGTLGSGGKGERGGVISCTHSLSASSVSGEVLPSSYRDGERGEEVSSRGFARVLSGPFGPAVLRALCMLEGVVGWMAEYTGGGETAEVVGVSERSGVRQGCEGFSGIRQGCVGGSSEGDDLELGVLEPRCSSLKNCDGENRVGKPGSGVGIRMEEETARSPCFSSSSSSSWVLVGGRTGEEGGGSAELKRNMHVGDNLFEKERGGGRPRRALEGEQRRGGGICEGERGRQSYRGTVVSPEKGIGACGDGDGGGVELSAYDQAHTESKHLRAKQERREGDFGMGPRQKHGERELKNLRDSLVESSGSGVCSSASLKMTAKRGYKEKKACLSLSSSLGSLSNSTSPPSVSKTVPSSSSSSGVQLEDRTGKQKEKGRRESNRDPEKCLGHIPKEKTKPKSSRTESKTSSTTTARPPHPQSFSEELHRKKRRKEKDKTKTKRECSIERKPVESLPRTLIEVNSFLDPHTPLCLP